jgi:hypothetical protein
MVIGWTILAIFAIVALLLFFWGVGRVSQGRKKRAREVFHLQREKLQEEFFDAAAISGKPRGLRWKACQWSDMIEWVRDRKTGQIHAFVGVTISFEAIAGGDMEGVAAVGNLRNASAVFDYWNGQWSTQGRAIFNLNPDEAVEHFKAGYERIEWGA